MTRKKEEPKLYEGTCLWFSDRKGYGFIEAPQLGMDITKGIHKAVFVHFSRVVSNEVFKTLSKGQLLTFEVVETEKGLMAVNVCERKIIKTETKIV